MPLKTGAILCPVRIIRSCHRKMSIYCYVCTCYRRYILYKRNTKEIISDRKKKGSTGGLSPSTVDMKRSYFLTRRIHGRHGRRHTRRHPRYHHTHTRRSHRPHRQHRQYRQHRLSRKKGGAIGVTISTKNGIPVGKNALATTYSGKTYLVRNMPNRLLNAETSELLGDDDI